MIIMRKMLCWSKSYFRGAPMTVFPLGCLPRGPWTFIVLFPLCSSCLSPIIHKQGLSSSFQFGDLLVACLSCKQWFIAHMAMFSLLSLFLQLCCITVSCCLCIHTCTYMHVLYRTYVHVYTYLHLFIRIYIHTFIS